MLVLARKPGEAIVVTAPDGRRIVLSVVSLGPGRVRLGVTAPRDYVVDRNEVAERKDLESAERSKGTP